MSNVGKRIRDIRTAKGLTQTQLAKAAGCGQSLIGNLESGAQQTTSLLPQIAKVLGVSATWLADGSGLRDDSPKVMEQLPPYQITAQNSEIQSLFDLLTPSQQEDLLTQLRDLVEQNNRLFEELSLARTPLQSNRPGFRFGGAIVDNATPSLKKKSK